MDEKYYQTRFSYDKGRNAVWRAITAELQRYVSKDAIVLDLGCGYGDFISNIKAREKHALDVYKGAKRFLKNDIMFYEADALDMSLVPKKRFDVVFASNFLEHFDDSQLRIIMRQIKQKMKKGALIILIQPNYKYAGKRYFDDYTHKTAFTHNSLVDFLKANSFEIIRIAPRYLPFSMKSMLPKSYILTKIYLALPYKPFARQMLAIARLK